MTTKQNDAALTDEQVEGVAGGIILEPTSRLVPTPDGEKEGIIDPTLVVRTALRNAASVAGLMLTTDVAVTDLQDDEDPIRNAIV